MNETTIAQDGERTHVPVFEDGEDAAAGLREWARRRGVTAGRVTGVGASARRRSRSSTGRPRRYLDIPVEDQVEVLSMMVDVAVRRGEPEVHAHVVVGDRDGSTKGGHLVAARVRPTLEVLVIESPSVLPRRHDDRTGVDLIDAPAARRRRGGRAG